QQILRLINDLNSERFADRQKATEALQGLRDLAEPALRKALREKPTLEVCQRVESLLEKLVNLSPEELRLLRSVEVLENIGTPEALQVLKSLATGAPEARLTQEAKGSLERLAKRPAAGP